MSGFISTTMVGFFLKMSKYVKEKAFILQVFLMIVSKFLRNVLLTLYYFMELCISFLQNKLTSIFFFLFTGNTFQDKKHFNFSLHTKMLNRRLSFFFHFLELNLYETNKQKNL